MNYIVSIIIPVYKVEAYIERCLLSVMRQTYHDSAFECILVDDCSPDNSILIAQKLINGYHGIIDFKIIRNDKNRGLSVARNRGMEQVSGKYLFFLDSDDYLREDCLQVMLEIAAVHPDAEMIMGNCLYKRINTPCIYYSDKDDYCILDNNQLLKAFYLEQIPTMAWNSLITRELVMNNQLSFKPDLIHEDILWSSKLFPLVTKFILIPRITLIYEDNPSSIINSTETTKELEHFIVIMDELLKAFDNNHFVAYALFLSVSLLRMVDMSKCCSEDMREKVKQQRNQLMKHTMRHGRIVLAFFELLMYKPFSQLLRFRFVRSHIKKLEMIAYTIASFFNFMH